MQILILGGTAEARALAAELVDERVPLVSSLAGRVSNPALPAGEVRIGGFGGSTGLAEYLRQHQISAVVNATHPFAARISASAQSACTETGVPLIRLLRPGWAQHPDAENWHWVGTTEQAATVASGLADRVFLTTGRQTAARYISAMGERYTLLRVVQPPDEPVPPMWEVLRDRGPYTVEGERELLTSRRIGALVTKDSGGAYTSAKLSAAGAVGVPVVIIQRPPAGSAQIVDSVEAAAVWAAAWAEHSR